MFSLYLLITLLISPRFSSFFKYLPFLTYMRKIKSKPIWFCFHKYKIIT